MVFRFSTSSTGKERGFYVREFPLRAACWLVRALPGPTIRASHIPLLVLHKREKYGLHMSGWTGSGSARRMEGTDPETG